MSNWVTGNQTRLQLELTLRLTPKAFRPLPIDGIFDKARARASYADVTPFLKHLAKHASGNHISLEEDDEYFRRYA